MVQEFPQVKNNVSKRMEFGKIFLFLLNLSVYKLFYIVCTENFKVLL